MSSSASGLQRLLDFGLSDHGNAIIKMDDCFLAPGTVYTETVNLVNKSGRTSSIEKIELIEKGFTHSRGEKVTDVMKNELRDCVSIRFYDSKFNNYYDGSIKDLVGKLKPLSPTIPLGKTGSDGDKKQIKINVYLNEKATNAIEGLTYNFDFKIHYIEAEYIPDPDPDPDPDPLNTPPKITLIDDPVMIIKVGTDFVDPGATAYDKEDGNITSKIKVTVNGEKGDQIDTSKPGEFQFEYNVKDSEGLRAKPKYRKVIVYPITSKPIIYLIDKPYLTVYQHSNFKDPGAIAFDSIDGNMTEQLIVKINEGDVNINTDVLGKNKITYNVKNSLGIWADEVTRTVEVIPQTKPDPEEKDPKDDSMKDDKDPPGQEVIIATGQRLPIIQYAVGLVVVFAGATLFMKKEKKRG